MSSGGFTILFSQTEIVLLSNSENLGEQDDEPCKEWFRVVGEYLP